MVFVLLLSTRCTVGFVANEALLWSVLRTGVLFRTIPKWFETLVAKITVAENESDYHFHIFTRLAGEIGL